MNLYRDESSYAKPNAQRNLCGRTHFVDEATLRFHHSRVVRARVHDRGLLFSVITSDALDYANTKRGFRYSIFDVFGNVVARPELADAFKTSEQASKAMYAVLNCMNAFDVTRAAIESARSGFESELAQLERTVAAIEANANQESI
jgi:hypothetical protein